MSDEPLVRVEGLTVAYRGVRVVDDVSFTIEAGGSYGLVGESGSGKSTVAGTLTASLGPDAAVGAEQITVDGSAVDALRGTACVGSAETSWRWCTRSRASRSTRR
ncbi:ATP-binding cassette domain-containing protein [Curtobacterium flaccumfaciens]|nr:ATP-binding cassette domain-containing protein [Curtobacterium flaccumfaciens]